MATATVILPVQSAKLPATNPAAIDGGEVNWRLLFDDGATAETCTWQFRMPANYASALTAKLQFSVMSTQTGDDAKTVKFGVSVMAVTPEDAADIVTESFDTVNTGTKTLATNQTAGYLKDLSVTLTNADSVAAGDYVKIKLAKDVTDTVVGDTEVVAFSLEFTTT